MNSPEQSILPNQALTNLVWGRLTALTLRRLGLQHVVISPGSRSTPLVLGFVAEGKSVLHPVLDERSAGFFALGLAKSLEQPVALLCTSGSAVANYLPALVEAFESRIPLFVLTADRPPELQHCGAGQTICQEGIFGKFVRGERVLPTPGQGDAPWSYLVRTLEQLWQIAAGPLPGPVHANFPLREPLLPAPSDFPGPRLSRELSALALGSSRLPDQGKWLPPVAELPKPSPSFSSRPPSSPTKVLVIGGPWAGPGGGRWYHRARQLAEMRNWPLIADVLSPWRHTRGEPAVMVTGYDLILRDAQWVTDHRPDVILQVGALPTSKILRQTLSIWRSPRWIVDPYQTNPNPDQSPARFIGPVGGDQLWDEFAQTHLSGDAGYHEAWRAAEVSVVDYLQKSWPDSPERFEGNLYPLFADILPEQATVMVASSTPVRDAEWFWPPNNKAFQVFANRGANGIDGTLSTAVGLARGSATPAFLITGDLALLHDSNGILLRDCLQDGGSLTILLINNEGGGIFENLPISGYGSVFERYFVTNQKLSWENWAATYQVAYHRPANRSELASLISVPWTKGIRLIEWNTDRKEDARIRKQILRGYSK